MNDSAQNPPSREVVITDGLSAGRTTLLRHLLAELEREDQTGTAGKTLPNTPEGRS